MNKLFYFLLCGLILSFTHSYSQNVSINQFPSLPNQLKMSDLWNISISNFDNNSYNVKLKVSVRLNNSDEVLVAETGVFRQLSGTRNYQGKLLEPINYSLISDKIINSIRRTGGFPDGEYSICVDVINNDNLQIIANSCIDVSVATSIAPVLFAPYDGSDMYDNLIVWSWFMQPETSSGEKVVCDLIAVEILEGQTAEEAIKVNPPVLNKTNLTTASWQTNFAMRTFKSGTRYAWKVFAKADGKIINESEIWQFTYNAEYGQDIADSLRNSESMPIVEPIQDTNSTIRLSGKMRMTLENSNHKALLSNTPTQYARLEVEPTLTILGVPMGFNFLLTTEENTKKYNVNRGAFNYESRNGGLNFSISQRIEDRIQSLSNQLDSASIDSLREMTYADSLAFENRIAALYELQHEDYEGNLESLKEFGLISEEQEVIAQFPALGIGKVAPSFSGLFMNGVSITGGLIEYNPNIIYLGTAFGKLQTNPDLSNISINESLMEQGLNNPEFFQNVYSGRIGVGRRNGNNAILSVLYGEDDEQSRIVKNLLDSTGTALGNENNMVLGLSGRYNLENIGLNFSGEINSSVYNSNTNGGLINNADLVNPLMRDIFGDNIKNGALADLSYNFNASYRLDDNSTINSTIRFVGPGYRSVGVAGLRNDIMIYDIHFNRSFFDNKIRFTGFYSNEEAGYVLSDLNNSNINKIGSRLDIRFRNMPTFSVNYVGNMQSQKLVDATERDANSIHQVNVNSSYGYQLGYTRMISFLSYSYQTGSSKDSAATFDSHIIMASQRISLFDRFAAGLSGAYSETKNLLEPNAKPVYSLDLSLLHNIELLATTTLGFNLNYTQDGDLKSFYFNSRIAVFSNLETDLRIESRNFTSQINKSLSFQETVARLILGYAW